MGNLVKYTMTNVPAGLSQMYTRVTDTANNELFSGFKAVSGNAVELDIGVAGNVGDGVIVFTDNFEGNIPSFKANVGYSLIEQEVSSLYSPLVEFYNFAYFSPVLTDENSAFSFRVKGLSTSTSTFYFLGSELRDGANGNSAAYYRGSDGRFRFERDDGSRDQVTINSISDGEEYLIVVRNKVSNVQYDVFSISNDGSLNLVESKVGSSPPAQSTFTCIGARRELGTIITATEGAIFGVTLAGESSWTMQSTNDSEFNTTDYISSNDLIYSGTPITITSGNTVKTIAAEGL